jgi:hypothetical protein
VLVVAPACVVEPAKLVALAVVGEGHWITGALGIAAVYGISIFLIERLFTIVKPKLLRLRWFAKIWARIVVLRCLLILLFSRQNYYKGSRSVTRSKLKFSTRPLQPLLMRAAVQRARLGDRTGDNERNAGRDTTRVSRHDAT